MRLRTLLEQAACAYPIPLSFAMVSLVRSETWQGAWFGSNGYGWALLAASLPWTLARVAYLRASGGVVENARRRRIANRLALGYVPAALGCAAAISLAMGFVQVRQATDFLLLLFFPFSLPGLL
jgi:hypothetical protein